MHCWQSGGVSVDLCLTSALSWSQGRCPTGNLIMVSMVTTCANNTGPTLTPINRSTNLIVHKLLASRFIQSFVISSLLAFNNNHKISQLLCNANCINWFNGSLIMIMLSCNCNKFGDIMMIMIMSSINCAIIIMT